MAVLVEQKAFDYTVFNNPEFQTKYQPKLGLKVIQVTVAIVMGIIREKDINNRYETYVAKIVTDQRKEQIRQLDPNLVGYFELFTLNVQAAIAKSPALMALTFGNEYFQAMSIPAFQSLVEEIKAEEMQKFEKA